MFKDASFRSQVQERWKLIYPQLLSIVTEIDRLAAENRLSDQYNQEMWPLLKEKPNQNTAWNGDEDLSFDEAVTLMKELYTTRLNWMNGAITAGNFVTDAE